MTSGELEVLDTAEGFDVSLTGRVRSWVTYLPPVVFALGMGGLTFTGSQWRWLPAVGGVVLLALAWVRTRVSALPLRRHHERGDRRFVRGGAAAARRRRGSAAAEVATTIDRDRDLAVRSGSSSSGRWGGRPRPCGGDTTSRTA